jgi:gliding motility-associated-like protein
VLVFFRTPDAKVVSASAYTSSTDNWHERNYSSFANYGGTTANSGIYLVTKVYLGNYRVIDSSQGPRMSLLRIREPGFTVDAMYLSPGIIERDMDHLTFENVDPYCKTYYDLPFVDSKARLPGYYQNGFHKDRPTWLFCPAGGSTCTPRPELYRPWGFYQNAKSGDYIIGFDDTAMNWQVWYWNNTNLQFITLTTKLTESREVGGKPLKLNESYITRMVWRDTYFSGRNGHYNLKSRVEAPSFEWHVCAGDTLRFTVAATRSEIDNKGYDTNYLYWDTGIADARLKVYQRTSHEQSADFFWIPDTTNVYKEPHRFTVWAETKRKLPSIQFLPYRDLSSRTFLVYVHKPIESEMVVDSVQCGKIYAHAEDSLEPPKTFHYRWWLTGLDGRDTLDEDTGKSTALQAPDSGQYLLWMFVMAEDGTCPFVTFDTVSVDTFAKVKLTDTLACDYGLLRLEPAVQYAQYPVKTLWITGDDTLEAEFFTYPTASGDTSIEVHIADAKGCIASDTAVIQILSLPSFDLEDKIICRSDTAILNVPPLAEKFLWESNDSVSNPRKLADTGTVALTVWDTNGCAFTDSMRLSWQQHPQIRVQTSGPACKEDSITLEVANPGTWNQITWNLPDTGIDQSYIKDFAPDDSYPFSVDVLLDSQGVLCHYNLTGSLELNIPPVFKLVVPDTLCAAYLPRDIGLIVDQSVTWTTNYPGNRFNEAIDPVHGQKYYGPFPIHGAATDTNGCIAYDSTEVVIALQDELDLNLSEQYCVRPGDTIAFEGGSQYGFDVQWTVNGTATENPYLIAGNDVFNSSPLTIAVKSTPITACPEVTSSATAGIDPVPDAGFSVFPERGCSPLTVNASADSTGYDQYNWFVNNALFNDEAAWTREFMTGQHTVHLIVTNRGCSDTSAQAIAIEVVDPPVINLHYKPSTVVITTPEVMFSVETDRKAQKISWEMDGQFMAEGPSFRFEPTDTGRFFVRVEMTDDYGCTARDSAILQIHPKAFIFFPNAFSPNGDQINDVFQPVTFGIEAYNLLIFNRWGQQVYSGENGVWNGQNALPGVYVFKATYTTITGETETISGEIHLIR